MSWKEVWHVGLLGIGLWLAIDFVIICVQAWRYSKCRKDED